MQVAACARGVGSSVHDPVDASTSSDFDPEGFVDDMYPHVPVHSPKDTTRSPDSKARRRRDIPMCERRARPSSENARLGPIRYGEQRRKTVAAFMQTQDLDSLGIERKR
jgi:hypothetical protein